MGCSLARLFWDGVVHVSASSGSADEMMMFNRGTRLKSTACGSGRQTRWSGFGTRSPARTPSSCIAAGFSTAGAAASRCYPALGTGSARCDFDVCRTSTAGGPTTCYICTYSPLLHPYRGRLSIVPCLPSVAQHRSPWESFSHVDGARSERAMLALVLGKHDENSSGRATIRGWASLARGNLPPHLEQFG
jgi:hypothetical protein